ncbi:hypothetical protein QNZ53_002082 [Vibrio parahaemolyticus]|nr:hypothetical protein [Vibrio parahaemolyticus]
MIFSSLASFINQGLQEEVNQQSLSDYEIFGKQVEGLVCNLVSNYFEESEFSATFSRAKNKNEFPDLKVTVNSVNYALEIKAGESSTGPGNDMGTLRAYPKKLEDYNDNIYCIFIKYSKPTGTGLIVVNDVYFEKIYKFIGRMSGNPLLLKYRKKDGNLRPKCWNDFESSTNYFSTKSEFETAIVHTNSYRSESIIIEHLERLSDSALNKVKRIIEEKVTE